MGLAGWKFRRKKGKANEATENSRDSREDPPQEMGLSIRVRILVGGDAEKRRKFASGLASLSSPAERLSRRPLLAG